MVKLKTIVSEGRTLEQYIVSGIRENLDTEIARDVPRAVMLSDVYIKLGYLEERLGYDSEVDIC